MSKDQNHYIPDISIANFDWRKSTFQEFANQLLDYISKQEYNSLKIIAKSQYLIAVSITTFNNGKADLARTNVIDGTLKIELLSSLFSKQEQRIMNALVDADITDFRRVSLEKLLGRQFQKVYDYEKFDDDTQSINNYVERIKIKVYDKGKLND